MKNLFIISGGPGKEHDVSRASGKNITEVLHEAGIVFEEMIVTKDGGWIYNDTMMTEGEGLEILHKHNALVFQAIHGTYGEDGKLVVLLEKENIAYIGSSAASLALTIDKYATEKYVQKYGVTVPSSFVITKGDAIPENAFTFPVIVKPNNEGSSVALHKVISFEALQKVVLATEEQYYPLLIQEYVSGREFTCGVVEINGKRVALAPTEIILTKGEMFDYDAKYTVGGCVEVTPADIDEALTKRIQNLALWVHTLCGCKDISRTDIIMKENGELVVLEINTIPGMTKTSFIPAQLQASGYTVPQFINGMLEKYKD